MSLTAMKEKWLCWKVDIDGGPSLKEFMNKQKMI